MITFQQCRQAGLPRYRRTRAGEMADTMCELAFAGRTVDEAALCLAGFTRAEIAEHGPTARDIATRQAVRRVDAHA